MLKPLPPTLTEEQMEAAISACIETGKHDPSDMRGIIRNAYQAIWMSATPSNTVTITRAELSDLVSHIVGMASAYETYASRLPALGRPVPDPLFRKRSDDFKKAAVRATHIARKYRV